LVLAEEGDDLVNQPVFLNLGQQLQILLTVRVRSTTLLVCRTILAFCEHQEYGTEDLVAVSSDVAIPRKTCLH
jgi:hypothetical protein